MEINGLLLIDKPSGWTSHDVVAKIRGILKKKAGHRIKVGHTGTLDPLATGLMIIVVGNYCKRAQEFSKLNKTYAVTMKLGETSTTGDEEGEKTIISKLKPAAILINQAITSFIRKDYMQTPPAYSAIKVEGKRAYKLAREGKKFKLEPRPVTIYETELINYDYPVVSFIAKVSSGTYIRSLVEDIGERLGTGAYMSYLRRTQVGDYHIEQAYPILNISEVNVGKYLIDA